MEAKVYNQKGKESGTVNLPERVFAAKWRSDLVHQVVESMKSNKRAGTADAKDRGEVRGGGKKPWRQKGTGRARHGSSRSPIWVGGGVTHGPLKEKNYKKKISKKMRAQALFSVLSKKLKDGEVVFVDSLALPEIKTRAAAEIVKNLKINRKTLMALHARAPKTEKSFRNLKNLELVFVKNLNPLDILNHKYLVVEKPEESVKFLESRG